MKSFLWGLLLLLSGFYGNAQRVCGTVEYNRLLNHERVEWAVQNSESYARDTVPDEVIIIPVVVHVLFNTDAQNISEAQVKSQIDALNRDFRRLNADTGQTPFAFRNVAADTRIMFCLAQVDPAGRPTKGIVRRYTSKSFFQGDDGMKFTAAGGNDAWNSQRYLNIWVCNLFGRSLGYASLPGSPADKDGVVINFDVFGTIGNLRSNYDKGRTCTHEVAHWLGLKHIWGDENCGDDGVDDTPKQNSYNYQCPVFPRITACSETANGDMFMNFMDYTSDACMNLFTQGQKKIMRSHFAIRGFRNNLLSSYVCDSSLASGAPLPDDTLVLAKPPGFITAYPNPVITICYLEPADGYSLKDKWLSVYQSTGVLVKRKRMTSDKETIDMSGLPGGVYYLKIGEGADRRLIRVVRI